MLRRFTRNKKIVSVCCQVIVFTLGFTYTLLQIWQVNFRQGTAQSSSNYHQSLVPSKSLSVIISGTSLDDRSRQNSVSKSKLEQPLPHDIDEPLLQTRLLLPSWLQDYQTWHAQQRTVINANNWRNFSYLVMQCLESDTHCGGTADRLRPIPLMLLVAYQHQRLLFVHWTTPKPLEEFLLPPQGGLDWRLPDFIALKEPSSSSSSSPSEDDMIVSSSSHLDKIQHLAANATIWHFRYQTHDAGESYFNEHRPENSPTFAQAYHVIWRFLFTPTRPIAERIQHHLRELELTPGYYSAVHIRAVYNSADHIGKNRLRARIQSAINCASQLGQVGTPILVASDSHFAMEVALAYARKRQEQHRYHRRIVTRIPPPLLLSNNNNESMTSTTALPLHLEKASNPELRTASDYYDIFVDLYLMGMSQCVVYTKGGFGYWARLISYNSSCGFRYQSAKTHRCRWVSSSSSVPFQNSTSFAYATRTTSPLFAPPIID